MEFATNFKSQAVKITAVAAIFDCQTTVIMAARIFDLLDYFPVVAAIVVYEVEQPYRFTAH